MRSSGTTWLSCVCGTVPDARRIANCPKFGSLPRELILGRMDRNAADSDTALFRELLYVRELLDTQANQDLAGIWLDK